MAQVGDNAKQGKNRDKFTITYGTDDAAMAERLWVSRLEAHVHHGHVAPEIDRIDLVPQAEQLMRSPMVSSARQG